MLEAAFVGEQAQHQPLGEIVADLDLAEVRAAGEQADARSWRRYWRGLGLTPET